MAIDKDGFRNLFHSRLFLRFTRVAMVL